jgi:hypothetical protein
MPKPYSQLPKTYVINIGMLLALELSSSVLATIEWLEWVRDELESEVTQELEDVMLKIEARALLNNNHHQDH